VIGQTISHYKILSKLGEGGMGVVYKAEDMRLKRTVALKFLPPELTRDAEAKERFINEAQAASALDHPNICTIHEIDQTEDERMFIVIAYYEGDTLRRKIAAKPLDVGEAVRIALQIARGLGRAHEAGIVHRDIKPGNIVITDRGDVKIVDFGLAKLAGQAKLTKTGSTLGTAAYMSPEQAKGEEIDGRTDIWSLGVVIYEMVTGKLPFKGEHEQAIIYSILNQAAQPVGKVIPGVPKKLELVLGKALAKNPAERYQQMEDMAGDLELLEGTLKKEAKGAPRGGTWVRRMWVGVGVVLVAAFVGVFLARTYLRRAEEKPITSIAVLPFQNLSADSGQEYFSDGMTEAIIKELSQIKALRVISRTSVMRYKNTKETIPDIAHALGIDAVVEGSVLKADHEVRITAQLIAAHPEKHIWADDFTRNLENILSLQSEVAQAIAREIKVAVTPEERERLAASRPVNPEAHEAYLKGRYFAVKSTPDDWHKAAEYFQHAVDVDSTYALAYAGLGEAYNRLASSGIEPPGEAWPKVKAYGERALVLDSTLAEGVLLIADAKYSYDWDVKGAEEYYKRALELNPNLAMAHFWYGWFLATQGRFDNGIAELKRGVSLDPLWPRIMYAVSNAYMMAGEYDSALVYLNRIAEIDSSDSHIYVGKPHIYLRQGKYTEAIEEAEKGVARGITPCLVSIAEAYALTRQSDKAREFLARFYEEWGDSYYGPLMVVGVYCALGDRDKVFELLEKAYQEGAPGLVMPALAPPWCDFIKSDPRYHDLMRRVGIEK
jgi:TolB-like protein/tRNA A-37 threonylcarbamoyl transferase component Bud32